MSGVSSPHSVLIFVYGSVFWAVVITLLAALLRHWWGW